MNNNQFNTLCQEATLLTAWNLVKAKGSAGGIDGVSLETFNKERHKQIQLLAEELKSGKWKPYPYLQIEVPKKKNPDEFRKLGMSAVRDKIVQHAIKYIIEPRYEKIFVPNTFGYRPKRGAVNAIRQLLKYCVSDKYKWVLRLDIDNFFDTIDHNILLKRLVATGVHERIVQLIMLSIKMGKVDQSSGVWNDVNFGIPQGAVLSPILSNLYLHPFDQSAVSKGVPYIRYADDFLFLCENKNKAEEIFKMTEQYLKTKMKLLLNTPVITELSTGFEFLGMTIKGKKAMISDSKREELSDRIHSLLISKNGLQPKSAKTWTGITSYYGKLLPQSDLEFFDEQLINRFSEIINDEEDVFGSKSGVQFALSVILFLSKRFNKERKQIMEKLTEDYLLKKNSAKQKDNSLHNKKIIQQRKKEYRKKESEASGLLVNKAGTFIGLTNRGVTVSQKGKNLVCHNTNNLSQIIVTGNGISLSSNLIDFCLNNKIPIDFFDHQGTHLGSVMSSRWMENTLWAKQAEADITLKHSIALGIIDGKIKNQHGLIKYFHKYHKQRFPALKQKLEQVDGKVNAFREFKKHVQKDDEEFMQKLMGHEAQVAIFYWDYIRELVVDDNIGFDKREHKGATDLMNSMLNYGYAILYVRVWQALLAAHLNPFDSIIHVRQSGKPTLVYDLVEIFRSQVVDRMVISLIQKGQELAVRNGLLTDQTRQLLVKAVMERLERYEKWQGEEMKMEQIIQRQAKMLAKAFEGKEKFKPYVAKW